MTRSSPSRCARSSPQLAAKALALLVAFASLPALAEPSVSDDRLAVRTLRIEQLVEDGQCDEALAQLESERAAAPRDAQLAMLQGECLLRQRQYGPALDALREAKESDPTLEDLDLYIAMASYHLEDFATADAAITDARDNTSARALAHYELYRGLLLLHRGQNREAALALERARIQNAAQVEPVASYYAGMAWQSVNEREAARESFQRVIDVDGDGVWGRQARAALEGASFGDRAFFSAEVGLLYDSNPVVAGDPLFLGPVAPDAISRESDGLVSWFLQGGAELFRTEKWSGGALATYAGNAHFHVSEFDTHYPTVGGWVDYDYSSTSLFRLRYDAGYAWVDYDDYATTQAALFTWFRNWHDKGNTELSLGWLWNDYHYPIDALPTSPDGTTCGGLDFCWPQGFDTAAAQNRDGNGLLVEALYRYDVRGLSPEDFLRTLELRGGYTYFRYWSKGTDWDSQAHILGVGAAATLPWQLRSDLEASFTYQPYDNVSSYPQSSLPVGFTGIVPLGPGARTDKIWWVHFELERPISDLLTVSTRYFYLRNISNVAVFDYDRHVVGAFLEFSL